MQAEIQSASIKLVRILTGLAILVVCSSCATMIWSDAWEDTPTSETVSINAHQANPESGHINQQQYFILTFNDQQSGATTHQSYCAQIPSQSGKEHRLEIQWRSMDECRNVSALSRAIEGIKADYTLFLAELGVAIKLDAKKFGLRNATYAGSDIRTYIQDVQSAFQAGSYLYLLDSNGQVLKLQIRHQEYRYHSVLTSKAGIPGYAVPLEIQPLQSRRIILVGNRLPDARFERVYAFPIPDDLEVQKNNPSGLVDGHQIIYLYGDLHKSYPFNYVKRAGLVVLMPVALIVDIVTSPLQIIAFVIIIDRLADAAENISQSCLGGWR